MKTVLMAWWPDDSLPEFIVVLTEIEHLIIIYQ